MNRIAIVGGRDFTDYDILHQFFMDYFGPSAIHYSTIISGGERGADSLAKRLATECESEYIEYPANGTKYGKRDGFLRNKQIVDDAEVVVAFWNGKSRETQHTIRLAKEAKKITIIVYY